jgi:hypothetical protein
MSLNSWITPDWALHVCRSALVTSLRSIDSYSIVLPSPINISSTVNMGNALEGSYCSVCKCKDQTLGKSEIHLKKQTKDETIAAFNKTVQELTAQLHNDEAKLERYKVLNKDLASFINTLKQRETNLKKENNQLRAANVLLLSVKSSVYTTQV